MQAIKETIKRSKNGKASGCDNINVELIKYGWEKTHTQINDLIKDIWKNKNMWKEWEEEIVINNMVCKGKIDNKCFLLG